MWFTINEFVRENIISIVGRVRKNTTHILFFRSEYDIVKIILVTNGGIAICSRRLFNNQPVIIAFPYQVGEFDVKVVNVRIGSTYGIKSYNTSPIITSFYNETRIGSCNSGINLKTGHF